MSELFAALTRGYQRAVGYTPTFLPLLIIAFLYLAIPQKGAIFRDAYAVGIGAGIAISLFLGGVAQACYRREADRPLGYVALAYFGFAILHIPILFMALLAQGNAVQFLVFEQTARFIALAYLLQAVWAQRGAVAPPHRSRPPDIGIHALGLLLVAAGLYGVTHRDSFALWHGNTLGVLNVLLPLAAIVIARRVEPSAWMRFNCLAQVLFAQAGLAFLLGNFWSPLWWFGQLLFAAGLMGLGYGLTRVLLRSRSYTSPYEGLLQQDLMDKIVEFSPVGILLVDAELRHIRCNQMLEGMLGSPEPDAHMPALLERLSLSPAEFVETLTRSPMLVRHFDTSMGRHYEARIAAVIFRAKAQAYICVLIDRSAARKAEEEIRALNTNLAREVAERSAINADMETFVYSVSHDLRAPLRAVTGFSHILEQEHKEALNEEARFLLQKISSGANNMRQLIDGLLSYARLGRAHVSRAPFDMRTLVEEVVQQVREESGLHATQVNVGDLPSVSGDRALVAQVWKNLIDNAFKFSSKQDAPRVEISASTIEDECIYRVQDNGVGFDARFVDRLFGVFQRLHKQSEFEGTGVGLAIAQRIVHKHGGHMSAEAKEGEGAIFSFSLPLRPPRN